jgi:hypothetical protein
MLARFQVLMSTRILVPEDPLVLEEFTVAGMTVRTWPPYKCALDNETLGSMVAPGDVPRRLGPKIPQPVAPNTVMNGRPASRPTPYKSISAVRPSTASLELTTI